MNTGGLILLFFLNIIFLFSLDEMIIREIFNKKVKGMDVKWERAFKKNLIIFRIIVTIIVMAIVVAFTFISPSLQPTAYNLTIPSCPSSLPPYNPSCQSSPPPYTPSSNRCKVSP